jgi:hypothetical protein
MISKAGLCLALGVVTAGAAAADVRPGVPQLLDPSTSVTCAVPTTFAANGIPKQVLFLSDGGGISVKWEGQASRLVWPRAQLKGGEQRPAGVVLASNFGVLASVDGTYVRYTSPFLFTMVSPFGWVKDQDGLWTLGDNGAFSRTGLPVAPWRNVVGFAPSTNYLYGANLLWVGAAAGFNYTRGLYQAVIVGGRTYPTYLVPDYRNVSAICGVSGGYVMVYNGQILRHHDSSDPFAPLFTDSGLPPDTYSLQSLKYGPNNVDAIAYVGRTLWLNLQSSAPSSLFMPGVIRHVAIDANRQELIVSTSAGVFGVPYTLS